MRNSTMTAAALGAIMLAGAAGAQAWPQGGRPLAASLTGVAEAPGPGDPHGSGSFHLRINPGVGHLCYRLSVTGVAAPSAAHIHAGAAGVAGPVRVVLAAPANGMSQDCVTISRELAVAILTSPGSFYVNVHNAAYPNGAIRGQLHK